MWDLNLGHVQWDHGVQTTVRDMNMCPVQWVHGVLTTGPLGNFQNGIILNTQT